MCRYAGQTYKSHFACFLCRKVFRKTAMEDYVEHVGLKVAHDRILFRQTRLGRHATPGISYEEVFERYVADVSICPQCGKRMAAVGLDFKAPPHRKKEAWEILRDEVAFASNHRQEPLAPLVPTAPDFRLALTGFAV